MSGGSREHPSGWRGSAWIGPLARLPALVPRNGGPNPFMMKRSPFSSGASSVTLSACIVQRHGKQLGSAHNDCWSPWLRRFRRRADNANGHEQKGSRGQIALPVSSRRILIKRRRSFSINPRARSISSSRGGTGALSGLELSSGLSSRGASAFASCSLKAAFTLASPIARPLREVGQCRALSKLCRKTE